MFENVFNVIRDTPFEDPIGKVYGEQNLDRVRTLQVGEGSNVFRGDRSGIWLGAEDWEDAAFRVNMAGVPTVQTLYIGDDAIIRDIDVANTFGVIGQQSGAWGEVDAAAFNIVSSRKLKKAIKPVARSKITEILAKLNSLQFVEYRYRWEKKNTEPHLGLIAEDSPTQILDRSNQKAISLGDCSLYALFGARTALSQIKVLEAEVGKLKRKMVNSGRTDGL